MLQILFVITAGKAAVVARTATATASAVPSLTGIKSLSHYIAYARLAYEKSVQSSEHALVQFWLGVFVLPLACSSAVKTHTG